MVDKLANGFINSVYHFDDYTLNELICKLAQKMDEVITQSNESFNFLDWLKGEGLTNEVINLLLAWKEDGTLETIINENIFNKLKNRLDKIEIKNNKFITPHEFKIDTDLDDTDSLQKAINYCIENKVTLKADKDLYLISKTLNIREIINIDFENATIKAISDLESMLKLNVTIRPNGVHVLGTEYGCISNITFDCNNMCNKCIYIEEGRKYLLDKIKIYNMNGIGIDIRSGYEIMSKNIDMVGTNQNSVGIRINTSDCHFSDIVLTDVKRGIINSGTNFYSRIHGWMFTKGLLASSDNPKDNSIFFTHNGGGTPQLNQCYSDTYFTSIYVTNYTRIFLNGLTVFYSEYVYNNDLLNYTPHLFYYEKTGETDYNIHDFSRQSIMTNCMVRGVNSSKYIRMSNLPKGTSLIRCNNDNNELTYVTGIEDNCISGLNIKTDFSFTKEKCYNIVNRKDNRVTCKLKLYREGGFEKNTDYTIALFTNRYKPNMEFITTAGISTDGYSSNFTPCYCYVSPDYGITIKTPNDDIPTRKYVTVDLVFDMDYWN